MTKFQQMRQNTDPSVEKIDELKRSGHDDGQIAMYTRGYREAPATSELADFLKSHQQQVANLLEEIERLRGIAALPHS